MNLWVELGRKLRAGVEGIVEWVVLVSVGDQEVFQGGFGRWKGSGMVEAGGWLLGEIGGTTGRSLKARSGVGLLEKKGKGLLRISEGK